MGMKAYVRVLAEFDEKGNVRPISLMWEDGRIFDVEELLCVKRAGGNLSRYQTVIRGQETYLYREGERWFMQRRE